MATDSLRVCRCDARVCFTKLRSVFNVSRDNKHYCTDGTVERGVEYCKCLIVGRVGREMKFVGRKSCY